MAPGLFVWLKLSDFNFLLCTTLVTTWTPVKFFSIEYSEKHIQFVVVFTTGGRLFYVNDILDDHSLYFVSVLQVIR